MLPIGAGLSGPLKKSKRWTPEGVNNRIVGWSPRLMETAPATTAWAVADSALPDEAVNAFGTALGQATTWVQQRESFAGQPGILGSARQRMLAIDDPEVQSAGMDFLDSLQALPPDTQAAILAYLRGQRTGVNPLEAGAVAAGAESLFLSGQADVEAGEEGLSVTLAPETASEGIAIALKKLFPQLDVSIAGGAPIDDLLIDISDATADSVMSSQSAQDLTGILEKVQTGELGPVEAFLPTVLSLAQIPADLAAGGWGMAGRSTPVTEDFTDRVAEEWHGVEEQIGKVLAPVMTYGLDPKDPDYEMKVQQRMGAFILLAPFGASILSKAGRRIKLVRSVAGDVDVVRAVQESSRSVRRTGVLGTAAESYRGPIRAITKAFDEQAIKLARDPEQWFADGINGRGGRQLINVLKEAKSVHPGNGIDAVDAQVGFVREVYGSSQIPAPLVRKLLEQTTDESVKLTFMRWVNTPGGETTIKTLQGKLDEVNKRLDEVNAGETIDLQEVARLRLEAGEIQWRLDNTFDNNPIMRYPKKNAIRAVVRAPVTPFEKMMYRLTTKNALFLDPAKLVDELPSRPQLFVPQAGKSPANFMDQNSHTISNYLRRAGVPEAETQRVLGKLGRTQTSREFYELIEKEVFGEGGIIDKHLPASIDPDLRSKIIHIHESTIESRTRSQITTANQTQLGPQTQTRHVLGRETAPGETTPLPSRPSEELETIALPNVDHLISANSLLRRTVSRIERGSAAGKGLTKLAWDLPFYMMRTATAVLKPLVMVVRLPAMIMRIQLEQGLRMQSFGYKPFKGLPNGLSLLPGGIPIPRTSHRVFSNLFGEDGWRMLDPDPRVKGLSNATENNELGMFMDEVAESAAVERTVESTLEFRNGRRVPAKRHHEASREELATASQDWLDRKIAQLHFSRERILAWLDSDPKAAEYMRTHMDPRLPESTAWDATSGRVVEPAPSTREWDIAETARPGSQVDSFEVRDATDDAIHANASRTPGTNEYHLNFINVPEEFRRQGIGGEMYEQVAREVESRGGKFVSDANLSVEARGWWDKQVREGNAQRVTASDHEFEYTKQYGRPRTDVDRLADARGAWIDGRIEYLRQITKGEPDMVHAVATGKLRKAGGTRGVDVDGEGKPVWLKHQAAEADLVELNTALKEHVKAGERMGTPEQQARIVALQTQRRMALAKIRRIERENPDVLLPQYVPLAKKGAARSEIKARWEAAPDSMPDRLLVAKKHHTAGDDVGLEEDIGRYSAAVSASIYRKMKPLTYVDKHGTRGSLFTQANRRYFAEMKARGYATPDARAIAHARAAELTRDLMYDLNARTSFQRALKDLFWFAPATQEVLYTWLVKIPSESYWPLGAARLAAGIPAVVWALEEMGVVQTDANGEKIIVVPGLDKLVELLPGDIKAPPISFGKLEGLNLVTTGGGVPGLSSQANFVLGQAALKHGGIFKELSDIFQPYGPEASLLPQPVTFLYEAVFGAPPPWEPMSPARAKATWDRTVDMGIQYAYAELNAQGIKPPRPEDYGTYNKEDKTWTLTPEQELAYKEANDEYLMQLFDLGNDYARGQAVIRFLGSTVAPMSLYSTSEEREQWNKFWNEVIVPEGFGDAGLKESQQDLITEYLGEHPNSLGYSIYTTGYGDKEKDLPFAEEADDAFYDEYYTGEKRTLTGEEFIQKLVATESRRFYQQQLDRTLHEISPTLDWQELLTNGSERTAALQDYKEAYDRWLFLNPDADALLRDQSAAWAEANNVPVQSYEAERLGNTIDLLKQITPMLTGEENIRPQALREVQAQLAELYSETGEFGKPNTEAEKAMNWWFKNMMDPYLEKAADIYDRIEYLQNRGLDASAAYDELRQLQNRNHGTYKGKPVPTVEEVFFGNRTKEEREAAINTWTSRPISWLTDFQREKVGYEMSKEVGDFFDTVAQVDIQFYDYINNNGISASSKEYDALQAARSEALMAAAEKVGPDAVRLLALSEGEPYERLRAVGYGEDVPAWNELTRSTDYIVRALEAEGLSPKGFSEEAIALKTWFYTTIQAAREADEKFDQFMVDLSHSFPMDSGGWREGAALYEAVFFGGFNEEYIPAALANIGL